MSNTFVPCLQCDRINRVPLGRAGAEAPICGNCQTPLPVEYGIVKLTGGGLQHLVSRIDLPVVVDFWATWCVPCRAFELEFQKAAEHFAGRVVFAKVDAGEQFLAASVYGIRSIPTLIFFRGGNEIERITGAVSFAQLTAWIDTLLGKETPAQAA